MKIIARCFIGLVLAAGSFAYSAVPSMSVIVSDASGRAAYRGATDGNGSFSTATLKPGNYVVQFNSKRKADVKGNFALVVAAGRKKVVADSIAGEKFGGGGVAMRIEVDSGSRISGQIAEALQTMLDKEGRRLVWIPERVGTHLAAHWAPVDSPDAKEVMTRASYSFQNIQNIQAQGVGMH
jgi:hypothetical protein